MSKTCHPVDTHLLKSQANVTAAMRSILVGWMWEVCKCFRLNAQTFFKAVSLLDRFLAHTAEVLLLSRLQLTGIVAMIVASKLEETWSPELQDFVFICDRAYTAVEIASFEKTFVSAMDWRFTTARIKLSSSIEEYAAVIIAIDGCPVQKAANRPGRAYIRAISRRLKNSLCASPRCMPTRSHTTRHDPLVVLKKSSLALGKLRAFYEKGGRLQFEQPQ